MIECCVRRSIGANGILVQLMKAKAICEGWLMYRKKWGA